MEEKKTTISHLLPKKKSRNESNDTPYEEKIAFVIGF